VSGDNQPLTFGSFQEHEVPLAHQGELRMIVFCVKDRLSLLLIESNLREPPPTGAAID
jgi:hypothetical protein